MCQHPINTWSPTSINSHKIHIAHRNRIRTIVKSPFLIYYNIIHNTIIDMLSSKHPTQCDSHRTKSRLLAIAVLRLNHNIIRLEIAEQVVVNRITIHKLNNRADMFRTLVHRPVDQCHKAVDRYPTTHKFPRPKWHFADTFPRKNSLSRCPNRQGDRFYHLAKRSAIWSTVKSNERSKYQTRALSMRPS